MFVSMNDGVFLLGFALFAATTNGKVQDCGKRIAQEVVWCWLLRSYLVLRNGFFF